MGATSILVCVLLAGVTAMHLNDTQRPARETTELWRTTSFPSGSHFLDAFKPQHLWGSISTATDPVGGSDNVLKVHYALGSYSVTKTIDRGAQFYSHVTPSHTAMMLSYDVFFPHDFDFVRGGKLPGLYGGITQTCSGGRHSDECFTTRFMWRDQGHGEVYTYIPKDHQRADYCQDPHVVCEGHFGDSLGRGTWTFKRGVWQNMAQYVHLNTPGQTDGYLRVFQDGQKVLDLKNLNFRMHDNLKVDGIFFSTFFGGSLNNSWASTADTNSYFRNFVLSMDSNHPVIIG